MLRNYLTSAIRNFRKHPTHSFINVAGLGVGIACCLAILMYVQDERSFDRFHDDAGRIYRINKVVTPQEGGEERHAISSGLMGPTMAEDYPQVDAALRVLAQLGPRDARHPAAVEEAARCHTAMGAHPKAAVEWMSLSLEDPKNGRYAKRTAHAFLAAGDARGARPYVVLAQQLAPDDPEVIELGRALTAARRTASP